MLSLMGANSSAASWSLGGGSESAPWGASGLLNLFFICGKTLASHCWLMQEGFGKGQSFITCKTRGQLTKLFFRALKPGGGDVLSCQVFFLPLGGGGGSTQVGGFLPSGTEAAALRVQRSLLLTPPFASLSQRHTKLRQRLENTYISRAWWANVREQEVRLDCSKNVRPGLGLKERFWVQGSPNRCLNTCLGPAQALKYSIRHGGRDLHALAAEFERRTGN